MQIVHHVGEDPRPRPQILSDVTKLYAQKDEDLYLIKGNPLYRNVARDPRYTAFLRKMKLPE